MEALETPTLLALFPPHSEDLSRTDVSSLTTHLGHLLLCSALLYQLDTPKYVIPQLLLHLRVVT